MLLCIAQGPIVIGPKTQRLLIASHLKLKRPQLVRRQRLIRLVERQHYTGDTGFAVSRQVLKQSAHERSMPMADHGHHQAAGT